MADARIPAKLIYWATQMSRGEKLAAEHPPGSALMKMHEATAGSARTQLTEQCETHGITPEEVLSHIKAQKAKVGPGDF